MTRHHLVNGVAVPFTPKEETDADANDAAWAALDKDELRATKEAESDPFRKAMVDTLLDFENRIRVLEGRAQVTRATALTALRNRIKNYA